VDYFVVAVDSGINRASSMDHICVHEEGVQNRAFLPIYGLMSKWTPSSEQGDQKWDSSMDYI